MPVYNTERYLDRAVGSIRTQSFEDCIGEENIEEINLLAAGANYGWPEREGSYAIDVSVSLGSVFALPAGDASNGFSYPVAQYDHHDVATFYSAIAGASVYRGDPSHTLFGEVIFGDIVSGDLFHTSVGDLLVADDGVPATTAQIYNLAVLRDGDASSMADIIAGALGEASVARTDLRLARVATGEIYITTKQDAYVRKLLPIEVAYPNGWTLVGFALGGYEIDFSVAGVALQITTTPGQTAEEVAGAIADAIQQDATLQGLAFYGYGLASRALTNGSAGNLTSGDPGIALAPSVSVPGLRGWVLACLALAMLAAGFRYGARPNQRA
jgi:hypothetical protein